MNTKKSAPPAPKYTTTQFNRFEDSIVELRKSCREVNTPEEAAELLSPFIQDAPGVIAALYLNDDNRLAGVVIIGTVDRAEELLPEISNLAWNLSVPKVITAQTVSDECSTSLQDRIEAICRSEDVCLLDHLTFGL